jgi:dihydrofolate reductase
MQRELAIQRVLERETPWDILIIGGGATGASLLRRQRFDRQRMDLAPHELTETAIDELMTRNAALADEVRSDHARSEMGLIV